jgi:hypothetical protein
MDASVFRDVKGIYRNVGIFLAVASRVVPAEKGCKIKV